MQKYKNGEENKQLKNYEHKLDRIVPRKILRKVETLEIILKY